MVTSGYLWFEYQVSATPSRFGSIWWGPKMGDTS